MAPEVHAPRPAPFKRARSTLFEAKNLIESKMFNGARNRIYYAVFQAIAASFGAQGIFAKDFCSGETRWRHDILTRNLGHSALGLAFDFHKFVRKARDRRETADYGDGYPQNRVEYQHTLEEFRTAERVIDRLEEFLAGKQQPDTTEE